MTLPEDALSQNGFPTISAVISTRNRGSKILGAIDSILNNNYPSFDLWIVDQSDDDQTERALQPFLSDSRLYYIKSDTRGCSAGRNLAISSSKSELIAITDDDCVVSSSWLMDMVAAFNLNAQIGIVCGNVIAGEHDATKGYITVYIQEKPFLAKNIRQKNHLGGITACMGVRHNTWQRVQGFDAMLGVGAPLQSGAESDFIIKALLAGYYVYDSPRVVVTHYGFRDWEKVRGLIYQYSYGTGAALAKYFKSKFWIIFPIISYELGYKTIWPIFSNLFYKHRLSGMTRLTGFFKGFVHGLFTPLDHKTGNFYKNT